MNTKIHPLNNSKMKDLISRLEDLTSNARTNYEFLHQELKELSENSFYSRELAGTKVALKEINKLVRLLEIELPYLKDLK